MFRVDPNMPNYPSANSLLQDAKLRLDKFGSDFGVLVVEGPDDKRLLHTHVHRREQIVIAGGRRLLMSAHGLTCERGDTRIVFLTDCDYETTLGTLKPELNLIVTEHADIESDLLAEDGFERMVLELVAEAIDSEEKYNSIVNAVRERSIAIAEIIGRARYVAKTDGFPLNLDELRHRKFRKANTSEIDQSQLIRVIAQRSDACPLQPDALEKRVDAIPAGYNNCNGHDMIAALSHVLKDDFGVEHQTPESLAKLLRVSSSNSFGNLRIAKYIRKWEKSTGRSILR